MPTIGDTMPAGIPGDISRRSDSFIEPIFLNPSKVPANFGAPIKTNSSGLGERIESGDTATSSTGLLVRAFPSSTTSANDPQDSATIDSSRAQGRLVRGYMMVKCTQGTPVKDGQVYLRVVAASGKLIGDLEATADGSNSVAPAGWVWANNGKDLNNMAEIRLR